MNTVYNDLHSSIGIDRVCHLHILLMYKELCDTWSVKFVMGKKKTIDTRY